MTYTVTISNEGINQNGDTVAYTFIEPGHKYLVAPWRYSQTVVRRTGTYRIFCHDNIKNLISRDTEMYLLAMALLRAGYE